MSKNTSTFSRRTAASAAVALILALASSTAMAMSSGDEGDETAGKKEACAAIGCPNGSRLCGTASGKITAGIPPFVGEIEVEWTCYENPLS